MAKAKLMGFVKPLLEDLLRDVPKRAGRTAGRSGGQAAKQASKSASKKGVREAAEKAAREAADRGARRGANGVKYSDELARANAKGGMDYGKHVDPAKIKKPGDHAHHIVFKGGRGEVGEWSAKSRQILEDYGINWHTGKENLTWAPNAGHSMDFAKSSHEVLSELQRAGASREQIVNALDRIGKEFVEHAGSRKKILAGG